MFFRKLLNIDASATGLLCAEFNETDQESIQDFIDIRSWNWRNDCWGKDYKGNLGTTDTPRLTTGIRSEKKCVFRRFRRCANVIEFTYTNLDNIAYCTPRLYGIAYCC